MIKMKILTYLKAKRLVNNHNLRLSKKAVRLLDEKVKQVLENACITASVNKRTTVLKRDIKLELKETFR